MTNETAPPDVDDFCPWIEWGVGECPIPDAKAGAWGYKTSAYEIPRSEYDAIDKDWSIITHYRVRNPNYVAPVKIDHIPAREMPRELLVSELARIGAIIDRGFGERSGSPGEWYYERHDELTYALAKMEEPAAVDHMALLRQCGEALGPFGTDELMDGLDEGPDDKATSWPTFKLGDFRKARAAIEALRKAGVEC